MIRTRHWTDDPVYDRLYRQLAAGHSANILRMALIDVPAAQGKAISGQTTDEQARQVYFILQLIAARKAKKLTQAQLAKLVGVTPATISHIETGQTSPPLSTVLKIVAALGLTWKLE